MDQLWFTKVAPPFYTFCNELQLETNYSKNWSMWKEASVHIQMDDGELSDVSVLHLQSTGKKQKTRWDV